MFGQCLALSTLSFLPDCFFLAPPLFSRENPIPATMAGSAFLCLPVAFRLRQLPHPTVRRLLPRLSGARGKQSISGTHRVCSPKPGRGPPQLIVAQCKCKWQSGQCQSKNVAQKCFFPIACIIRPFEIKPI